MKYLKKFEHKDIIIPANQIFDNRKLKKFMLELEDEMPSDLGLSMETHSQDYTSFLTIYVKSSDGVYDEVYHQGNFGTIDFEYNHISWRDTSFSKLTIDTTFYDAVGNSHDDTDAMDNPSVDDIISLISEFMRSSFKITI